MLEILKEAAPNVRRVAVLGDPTPSGAKFHKTVRERAATTLGLTLQPSRGHARRRNCAGSSAYCSKPARRSPGRGNFGSECRGGRGCLLRDRAQAAVDRARTRVCPQWRALLLRPRFPAHGRAHRVVCRADPRWCETSRSSDRAADEIRVRDQPEDRQGARETDSAVAAWACRSGDRLTHRFLRPSSPGSRRDGSSADPAGRRCRRAWRSARRVSTCRIPSPKACSPRCLRP